MSDNKSFQVVQWYYISDPCFEEHKLREFYICECSHDDIILFYRLFEALGFPIIKVFMYEYNVTRPANDRQREICKLINFADKCHFE